MSRDSRPKGSSTGPESSYRRRPPFVADDPTVVFEFEVATGGSADILQAEQARAIAEVLRWAASNDRKTAG